MNLRKSKALKFFAILLFSFEMIAPAVISGNEEAESSHQETRLISNEGSLTNFISSLLCEESGGEEEERESKDHKSTIAFTDFDFFEVFTQLVATETRPIARLKPHKITASQPALFTLFHTYLI